MDEQNNNQIKLSTINSNQMQSNELGQKSLTEQNLNNQYVQMNASTFNDKMLENQNVYGDGKVKRIIMMIFLVVAVIGVLFLIITVSSKISKAYHERMSTTTSVYDNFDLGN